MIFSNEYKAIVTRVNKTKNAKKSTQYIKRECGMVCITISTLPMPYQPGTKASRNE